jgi:hypothetical protein
MPTTDFKIDCSGGVQLLHFTCKGGKQVNLCFVSPGHTGLQARNFVEERLTGQFPGVLQHLSLGIFKLFGLLFQITP